MYMRLMGYPGDKISILTTYNGQKHLIRDVVRQRWTHNAMIGNPHKITTVDKYQGQQNDYIILSLVRTNTVGHLRYGFSSGVGRGRQGAPPQTPS